VGDFDVIPCCGTHVRATGELGAIKVLKWEKVKNTHRVYFVVGMRAVQDYALKHDTVAELATRFTTGITEVGAKVDKLVAENQSYKKSARAMSKRLAALEAESLLGDADETPAGVRVVARVVDGGGEYARALSSALRAMAKTVAVVGSDDGTVVCAASDDVGLDIAAVAVPRAKELGGSGGGKGSFAQLKLPDGTAVADYVEGIGNHVRSSL
jgi:alanyl-tRNA synthetase